MNQNNLFTFKVFFPFWVNLNIITFFLIVEIALSVDQQFEACKPWNCGNNISISYPFWVQGKQDPSCGMKGFELTCKNDKPILNMSGDDYVVRDIYYKNQSIWVTNAKILANTCPSSSQNLSLPQHLFSFGPSHAELFLFFNCTTPFPNKEYQFNPTGCSTYNSTRRSLALFSHDHNFNYLMNHSGNCENNVVAAVDKDDDKLQYRDDINILLVNGFHLVWKAINCSVCQGSGGRCGFDNSKNNFMCYCTDRPHRVRCNGHKKPNVGKKLGIGFGAGASGILLSCFLFFFIYRFHSKYCSSRNISFSSNSKTDLEYGSTYFGVHIFTYTELKEATNNFDISRELGDGGFGTVYHGKLRDGRVVAVKRLYENNYKRVEQFMNEVEILTRLRHQNLVTLYGCTSRNSRELLLVYEFIPNGTVGDHLHGDRSTSGMLTWPIRMNIAIETASALAYLHACDIIHRDVKTNNILLDNNFGVKVADFGLSRPFPTNVTHVSTAPQGTPGYVDPKYYQCYQLTDKSDVYSFGVVLFELISSKTAVDISRSHNEINLSNMAVNMIQNGALHELVDPGLGFESDWKVRRIITLVADLAYRCLQQEKEIRPSMEEVLESLRRIERGEWKEGMAEEVDIPSDEIGLLPVSLDSPMTDKSINVSTTPNTSG